MKQVKMALDFVDGEDSLFGSKDLLATNAKFWVASGASFVPYTSAMATYFNNGVVINQDDAAQIHLECPMYLPDDVTITEVILNGEITSGAGAVYYLYRKPIGGDDSTSEELGTGVIGSDSSIAITEKNIVDNNTYLYYIKVAGNVSVYIKVYDVRVNYSI